MIQKTKWNINFEFLGAKLGDAERDEQESSWSKALKEEDAKLQNAEPEEGESSDSEKELTDDTDEDEVESGPVEDQEGYHLIYFYFFLYQRKSTTGIRCNITLNVDKKAL